MKKTISLLFLVIFMTFLSAQENVTEEKKVSGLACGVYVVNNYALGSFTDFALCTIGGGLCAEYSLPVAFIRNIGVSARLEGGAIIPSVESIISWWTMRASVGAWIKFPLTSVLILQPELDYGITLHGISVESGYTNAPDGVYTDQHIQVAVGLRYLLKNIEIELAPMYTFSAEDGEALNEIGFRAGVIYRF